MEIKCKSCSNECMVEGEYPKFDSWCFTCNATPKGFDCLDFAVDYISGLTDMIYDRIKDDRMLGL